MENQKSLLFMQEASIKGLKNSPPDISSSSFSNTNFFKSLLQVFTKICFLSCNPSTNPLNPPSFLKEGGKEEGEMVECLLGRRRRGIGKGEEEEIVNAKALALAYIEL